MDIIFQLLWVNIKEQDCWIEWLRVGLVLKETVNCLPKWLDILHSYQQRMRVPVAPHPRQHWLLSVFQIFGCSDRCVVVSHWCFNLTYDGCGASFYILICSLYILTGKVSVKVLVSFFSSAVCFLTVELYEFIVYCG